MPTALIWGASSGMGQALIMLLKSDGWMVHATARDTSKIPTAADYSYEFDAGSPDTIEQTCFFISQQANDLFDLTVYFAGDLVYEKLDTMGYEGWMSTLNSNLNGAFLCATQSLNLMKDDGHMMFIGAYIDHLRLPRMGAYAVAKAGLAELVNLLRKENRRMHFTLMRPGAVDTPFWNNVGFKKPADAKSPDHIAHKLLEQYRTGQGDDVNL